MVYEFKSGREMLETVQSGVDLYSPSHGVYVFLYNDAGSIAYYYIDNDEARVLEAYARKSGEYWAGLLGPGGHICDDPSHELYDPFKCSNIDFCNKFYGYDWVPTHDMGCTLCDPQQEDITIVSSDYTEMVRSVDNNGRIVIGASGVDGTPWYYPKYCPECGRKIENDNYQRN